MSALPVEGLADRANADGEFRIAARDWNAHIALRCGASTRVVHIAGGRVANVAPPSEGEAPSLCIAAPEDDWARFLEPLPRPFYQDLWAAWVHHEFDITGDVAGMYAYYPALRRLLELLREKASAAL